MKFFKTISLVILSTIAICCSKEDTNNLNSNNVNEFHLVGISTVKSLNSFNEPYFTVSVSLKNIDNLKECFFIWKSSNQPVFKKTPLNLNSPNSFLTFGSAMTYKLEYVYKDGKVIESIEKLAG